MVTSVAIVTYNSSDLIERSLNALGDMNVVIVDNASSDDTIKRVSGYEHVRVIPLRRNRGFGTAANIAIKATDGDILLLNPDVVAEQSGIAALEGDLNRYPKAGIVAPQLRYPTGDTQSSARTFPSPLTMLMRRTSLGRTSFGTARLSTHLDPVGNVSRGVPVDWVLGAAMLIRREALDDVGGFDERFFLYGEDVDLCYRMWAARWQVRLAGGVTFVHDYQRQSAHTFDLRNRATRSHWISALRLFAKHPGLLVGSKPAAAASPERFA